EVLKAHDTLNAAYGIDAEIWSVTSYKALYDDATQVEAANLYDGKRQKNYIQKSQGDVEALHIFASDYIKTLPLSLAKWFKGSFTALGTDGFGLSENRASLRDHFQVDANHIVKAVLAQLKAKGVKVNKKKIRK
nr:hypothetical protein [Bacteroidales bacterium]